MEFQANMIPVPAPAPSISEAGRNGDQFRVIRKRNRVPLSCAPCRNRKLKCNRTTPCENCIKRGEASSCSYAVSGGRRKQTTKIPGLGAPDLMQNRIDRLEGLVLSLMTNGMQAPGPAAAMDTLNAGQHEREALGFGLGRSEPMEESSRDDDGEGEGESETDQVASSFGILHVANNRSMYVGDSHWVAVLSDIAEVKNYYATTKHKHDYVEQMKKLQEETSRAQGGIREGPAFLFGGRNLPHISELTASLPGRDAVDKMVDRFFNDYDGAIHIIHPAVWRRMYEKHWEDPSATDPAFLGQLFAICCLAMHSYWRSGPEEEPYEYRGRTPGLFTNYRQLTAQCLLLADFSKPVNHLLETMILHLQAEYSKSRDSEVGVWVLIGMIVRLAMRMGLHRDPKHYVSLTPFQGEMRRRLWTFVRQSDLLFSFQMGLPSMIRTGDCDTALPRNIYDHEFDEDTKVLPPPRAQTIETPVTFMIAMSSLSFVFGKIVERLQNVHTPPYEEIMALDNELRETFAALPAFLRLKPLEESDVDSTSTLIMRFDLSFLYYKSQCVLHRRYTTKARENPRYNHSRRTCVDASMELLRQQASLHRESEPNRLLHSVRWYVNSLTTHTFLLAATLVSLDLWHSAKAEQRGIASGDMEMWGTDRRVEMIEALKASTDIWAELANASMEAYKAAEIGNIMLKKLEEMHFQTENLKAQKAFGFTKVTAAKAPIPPTRRLNARDEDKPEHSAALTLGMLSTGGLPISGQQPQAGYPGPYATGVGSLMGEMAAPLGSAPSAPGTNPSDLLTSAGTTTAPSPFSLFTNSSGVMDNVDWDAWDSYVQAATLDPGNDLWPTNLADLPSTDVMDPQLQLENGLFGLPRDVTMGVDAPGTGL